MSPTTIKQFCSSGITQEEFQQVAMKAKRSTMRKFQQEQFDQNEFMRNVNEAYAKFNVEQQLNKTTKKLCSLLQDHNIRVKEIDVDKLVIEQPDDTRITIQIIQFVQ